MSIPSNTVFLGVDPSKVDLTERKSRILNGITEYYSIQDFNLGVTSLSIWANGFRLSGCINEDIILPINANLTYTAPLSMCVGKTLTVPLGTTLTIV
jgi:hypothetical protein